PSGTAYEIVKTGTGTTKPHAWDTVTFNYTAWESNGRMFDSTEMRSRPATVPVFKQSDAMEEMLTSMFSGSRVRFWVDSSKMQANNKPIAGMPDGLLTYEIELMTIQAGHEPPPVPTDLAGPPAGAKKSPKGVAYRVLKAGTGGPKPTIDQDIQVEYTGWTQDKRVFDSTIIKGAPADMSMNGVIVGWQDTLPLMSVGDKWRLWVPAELAYAGAPNRPQGMLVTDVELLAIKERPKGEGGVPAPSAVPAPPDVATPAADATRTPKGAFVKILKSVPDAQKPTVADSIEVTYTGWQTNGEMFENATHVFTLAKSIEGWQDAFPTIGVGEKARFWIPESLAYPKGGGPKGMLVFDVTLLGIKK
ncbi:MAG TPA: FKBP-type peptidyl-prolyl cis-trans isomerase, partial [Kofleriaceae bacterium]